MPLDYTAFFQNLEIFHVVNIAVALAIIAVAFGLYCAMKLYGIFSETITVEMYNLTHQNYSLTHNDAIKNWLVANTDVIKTNKSGLIVILKELLKTTDQKHIAIPPSRCDNFTWIIVGHNNSWVLGVIGPSVSVVENIIEEVLTIQNT